MKLESWIQKRWTILLIVLFFLAAWVIAVKVREGNENSAESIDARLQAILQAKAVLLGRMDEAEAEKNKQAYMQLLKAYVEKQNEYDTLLPGSLRPALAESKPASGGFTNAEKLEMLALEHGLEADAVKNLKSQIEIMFRETPAEDEALGKILKSK